MTEIARQMCVLSALCPSDAAIRCRDSGTWYVTVDAEIARDGMLESPTTLAPTPEQAVAETYRAYTTAPAVRRFADGRRFRWRGAWVPADGTP